MTEHTGYLSAAEVEAAQVLPKDAPYAITGISTSMFSVARHYGGMTFQGMFYTYFPEHDECVRDDVLRLVTKLRKASAKTAKNANADKMQELPFAGAAGRG